VHVAHKERVRAGQSPARDQSDPQGAFCPAQPGRRTINESFRHLAAKTSHVLGSPWTFLAACVLVAAWALTGPYFGYSDAWQLVINTSTTIGTFLMVFLLQSTQNRDTQAINIKLDELLRAIEGARTGLADLSELTDDEIEHLERELVNLARKTGVDEIPPGVNQDSVGGARPARAGMKVPPDSA
jgi:low affinity Fe/Cu permease